MSVELCCDETDCAGGAMVYFSEIHNNRGLGKGKYRVDGMYDFAIVTMRQECVRASSF